MRGRVFYVFPLYFLFNFCFTENSETDERSKYIVFNAISSERSKLMFTIIENGNCPLEAVAAIGVSRQVVEKSIQRGYLTSFELSTTPLFYQRRLSENGSKHLYYTNVLLDALKKTFPELAQQYDTLIQSESLSSAAEYAFSMAIQDTFEELTGMRTSVANLFYLLQNYFPQLYEKLQQLNVPSVYISEDEIDINVNQGQVLDVVNIVTVPQLKIVLGKVFLERGMIVYLNGAELKKASKAGDVRLMKGFEDDKELLLIADSYLPLHMIDGIQDLSV